MRTASQGSSKRTEYDSQTNLERTWHMGYLGYFGLIVTWLNAICFAIYVAIEPSAHSAVCASPTGGGERAPPVQHIVGIFARAYTNMTSYQP